MRRSREIPRAARVCARACGRLCRTGKARGGHVFFSSSHQRLLGNDRALLPYLLFFGSKPGARSGRFLGFQTLGKKNKTSLFKFFHLLSFEKTTTRATIATHARGKRRTRGSRTRRVHRRDLVRRVPRHRSEPCFLEPFAEPAHPRRPWLTSRCRRRPSRRPRTRTPRPRTSRATPCWRARATKTTTSSPRRRRRSSRSV